MINFKGSSTSGKLNTISRRMFILSAAKLIVFGGIVAFTAFNYLLKSVSPEKVATSAYVNPVIALFLGWSLLDEQLTKQSIIASVILLIGVYFITSRKRSVKTVARKGS